MFRILRSKDPEKNYINKAIIGLGVGLVRSKELLLAPEFGPQGAMDVLGVWIGQELTKEMLNQKKIRVKSLRMRFFSKGKVTLNLSPRLRTRRC